MSEEKPFNNYMEEVIYGSCLRKESLSYEKAMRVVDIHAKQNDPIFFYKCVFCGSHHMTRMNPADKKVSNLEIVKVI